MEVWLFERLRAKKMSQAQLARRIGIAPRTLCNKFGGKVPFTYNEVVVICDILEISNPLDYKWGNEKEKKENGKRSFNG